MADQPKKPREQIYVGIDAAPTFYANSVNVAVSASDMRLRFAQVEDATDQTVTMRTVATVYLSPLQAQSLRELLNKKAAIHDAIWANKTGFENPDTDGEA